MADGDAGNSHDRGELPTFPVEATGGSLRRRLTCAIREWRMLHVTQDWPERADFGALRLDTPPHATRTATRCIVLLRYPFGFQSMACGCITPSLSVARAQIS